MNYAVENDIIFYPVIDERRERQIDPSVEIFSQSGTHYFFSPEFKTSDIIVELVVKKYSEERNRLKNFFKLNEKQKIITCFDFPKKKQINDEVDNIRGEHFSDLGINDVLACFKDEYDTYLLTKNEMLSTYRNDDGDYLRVKINEVFIDNNQVYRYDGTIVSDNHLFSEEFQSLFLELQMLEQDVKLINCRHPLRNLPLTTREIYMEILIGKCLFDRYLSANEVIRIEVLSRQLGVSSQTIVNVIDKISKLRLVNREEIYLQTMVKKVNEIPREYYYVLFHDVIAFELLIENGDVKENTSKFTDEISKRCGLDFEFKKRYIENIQKFMKSSYDIRQSLEKIRVQFQNEQIINNIYDTVDFEYSIQQGMIRR